MLKAHKKFSLRIFLTAVLVSFGFQSFAVETFSNTQRSQDPLLSAKNTSYYQEKFEALKPTPKSGLQKAENQDPDAFIVVDPATLLLARLVEALYGNTAKQNLKEANITTEVINSNFKEILQYVKNANQALKKNCDASGVKKSEALSKLLDRGTQALNISVARVFNEKIVKDAAIDTKLQPQTAIVLLQHLFDAEKNALEKSDPQGKDEKAMSLFKKKWAKDYALLQEAGPLNFVKKPCLGDKPNPRAPGNQPEDPRHST